MSARWWYVPPLCETDPCDRQRYRSQFSGFVDTRLDTNITILHAHYRPLGIVIAHNPESPWLRQLAASGLNTVTSIGTPAPAGVTVPAHLQDNAITVFFPPLPSTAAFGAVPVSGWVTAGQEWRRMTAQSGAEEWQLWWRLSYSIVVRSATSDYIGTATQYRKPEVYAGTDYWARLVRENARQRRFGRRHMLIMMLPQS